MTKLVDQHLGKGVQPNGQPPKHEETEEELVTRMRGIMNENPVILFMKGAPDNPRCGFSRKAVNLLREQKVTFTHFDILEDEAVRQGDVIFCFEIHFNSFDDDRIEEAE